MANGIPLVQISNVQITENMDQIVIKHVLVQELNAIIMEFVLTVLKLILVQNVKFVFVKMAELVMEIAVFVRKIFMEIFVKFQYAILKYPITMK
jgi:hypothetical protein